MPGEEVLRTRLASSPGFYLWHPRLVPGSPTYVRVVLDWNRFHIAAKSQVAIVRRGMPNHVFVTTDEHQRNQNGCDKRFHRTFIVS